MNLRDLRYLVALADERHFGRAAERCFVSQPTLSAQIRKLEEYLGVPLVERRPRRVSLTETGEKVVARARRVLQEADAIVELARTDRDPLAGPLKLALIPTVGPYLLPHIVGRLRRELPRLKLMLYEYQTEPLLERLRAGDIDAGILALPVVMDGLESAPLYDEPFMLAVPASHPLADKERVKVDDIRGETLLLLEDGHCLREHALAACKIRSTEKVRRFGASSLLTLIEMVDADLGISFLPDMARGSALLRNTRVKLWPMGERSYRTIGLVWRKGSRRVEEFRLLGEFFSENR